jgi:hypothetical protein
MRKTLVRRESFATTAQKKATARLRTYFSNNLKSKILRQVVEEKIPEEDSVLVKARKTLLSHSI